MSRQAKQVHIFLYRKNKDKLYEFAIFQRSDNNLYWQGICGGVEKGESLEEASRREIFEEASIKASAPLHKLKTTSYLPLYLFKDKPKDSWDKEILVVPMYSFGMYYNGPIKISEEHDDFLWATYEEAEKLVYFHDQKVALWELKERLVRGMLI